MTTDEGPRATSPEDRRDGHAGHVEPVEHQPREHGHGGSHDPDVDPNSDPREFWDGFYIERGQIWSGKPNQRLVEAVADLAPGRALDLGCGEGGDAVYLAKTGWQVTASDVAPTPLERTRRHAEESGVADQIST